MSTGAPPLPATAPSAARTSGNSVVLQITRLNEELAYVRRELSEQREKVNTLEKSRDDTKRLMKAAVAQLNVQEKRNAELETALRRWREP
ncbi:hypothetical protein BDV93DRAFT_526291 [Ceratobasidium sp. AG-I]|nr:hypothetical protein BDV93DRAFT_526291 [Ceratobasidium sp. AG-I]